MTDTTWHILTTQSLAPAENMAIDEAVAGWVARGELKPTLRFYSWAPHAISVGRFQRATRDLDREALAANGIPVVRRLTGGRAVLHADELTYSVILPETTPTLPTNVIESYRLLTEGVRRGYRALGVPAEFSVPLTEEDREVLRKPKSAVCFDAASYYELAVDGRKVAGSAQVRHQGAVLQHGSIPLSIDDDVLFDCFNMEADEKVYAKARFSSKAVALNETLGRFVTFDEVAVAFEDGFRDAFQLTFEPLVFTATQRDEIARLVEKYESDDWVWKR
ncbi:lipoate--protein ligase family protein [Exiguobacterium sp. SH3S2]|uniref:lipoate--protein ligase family protein n=1 Tax=unclassified Exiguobacterium TaxID=2644629 RepID=UPI001040ADBD|nr:MULTISPECIES: lipoate--protein ligase family protein [unclassified Exiguobacterium]TCI24621.1 lipoate--protein ligase family protein [Exiguobacterium sp. SH5S4]TCI44844.1 lipoate--protein ligase family protein [Exiguobacterium sp. SH3S3]TCI53951.1 lipoate--protein ligase family protein [Exiguobacterium sp. SH5S13]TCI60265.1 lipoate--protein ligase family protein [Exiguobacterium sp. SH3S2]TCI64273.1 lipoate--protein ligase family protein [Exiguobacterium sp. SH3S1]